jgi:hypothetical protein
MTKITILISPDSNTGLQYAKSLISNKPYVYENKTFAGMIKKLTENTKVVILEGVFKRNIEDYKFEHVYFVVKNLKETGFTVSDIDSKKIDIVHLF